MAHRRNQGPSTTTTPFSFDRNPIAPPPPPPPPYSDNPTTSSSSTSLAAKAIRASSAHKDSSLSSAYGQAALSDSHTGSFKDSTTTTTTPSPNDYTLNEPKHGFWGALARKAKAILEVEDDTHTPGTGTGTGTTTLPVDTQTQKYHNLYRTPDSHPKQDTPPTTSHKKGLGAIASSLNSIGGAIGNALEEGLTVVENRTADIIQETRKLHIRKKGSSSQTESMAKAVYTTRQQPSQMQTDQDIQLKASRDVAMAMAAKAKLLLRELKTVKADLAFAKERCAQLEDENKILRENRQNGSHLEDDDLIRLQLETLLAEKARLAQENSFYARENRFLREIVEYHQLTMQDVVYFDQGTEEVTEVYPIKVSSMTNPLPISTTLPPPPSPSRPGEALHDISLQGKQHVSPGRMPPLEFMKASQSSNSLNPAEDSKRNSIPSA